MLCSIPGYWDAIAKYAGTIYHCLSSLPRKLVPTLLIDGEKVAQLDISSAHPCTLVNILLGFAGQFGVKETHEEADSLRRELESGQLYAHLASESRIKGVGPKRAKGRFLPAVNGKDGHTYHDEIFKTFSRLFPLTGKAVGIIRAPDRRNISRQMAFLLSKAIDDCLEACMGLDLPAYPRTDEIVCRERDAELVRRILALAFHKHTTVNPMIGKKRVDLLDGSDPLLQQVRRALGLIIVDDKTEGSGWANERNILGNLVRSERARTA
jgi:hypothetical protein